MTTLKLPSRCPGCGAEIPPEAPQGLCPKCLLAGIAQPTEATVPVVGPAGQPPIATVAAAFPQLEIVEYIGHGGMGVVYKARQTKLQRSVALKILPQGLASDTAFRERFTREGRVLARLNHPNIVSVYDFGEAGGFFYLLMEYVDGANLRQAMRAGRFSPAQALEIVPKICEALQYAHNEGVLHRDIKPENILLDTKGRVKIADFGIAKLMGDREADGTLTATGAVVGTPQYMAPEQLEHPQDVDHRADIYSLGVVFYEMLTGELPLGRFAPPSAKTPVDSRVDDVVFRTLEKEREKRFQNAGDVKTELEGITSSQNLLPTPGAGRASVSSPVPGSTERIGSKGQGPRDPDSDQPGMVQPARLGSTTAGQVGDDLAASAVQIRPEHRQLVLMGLAVVLVLTGLNVLPLPGLLISTLAGAFHTGVVPAFWTSLSVAAGGWVIYAAWVNRRRLLEPLGIAAAELAESEAVPPWASQRIMGTMAMAVLMALTANVASQVVLLVSSLPGFIRSFSGPAVLALLIGMTLGWWLLRARQDSTPRAAAAASPPWQSRVGVLFLVLGGVAFVPSLAQNGMGIRYWQLDALLAVTGVALLTRSRAWRSAALMINTVLIALGAAQIVGALLLMVRPTPIEPGLPAGPGGPELACVFAALQVLAFVAGLCALSRRDVRLSFGLGEGLAPPMTTAAAAMPARMSRPAVWSVVLVGSSLVVALPGSAVVALSAKVAASLGGGGVPLAVVILGLVALSALGAAITGTVLGIVAWREIGRSGGRIRGKALAVIGALTWPVLLAILAPLALLSVGSFTLREEPHWVSAVPGDSPVRPANRRAVLSYQIPPGQAAVFEVVTRDLSGVAPLPGFAAYALAPADAQSDAVLRLEPAPLGGSLGVSRLWQFELTSGTGSAMTAGLRMPDTLAESIHSSSARILLQPAGEIIHWVMPLNDDQASLGVRARTCAHGLPGIDPGGPRSCGVGTNWMADANPEGG